MAEIINRQLEIRFPNNDHSTITDSNIIAESMTIVRSLCDGDFKLGGCIAAQFELQMIGISPDQIQGKKIQAVLIEYSNKKRNILYPRDDLIPSNDLLPDIYLTANASEKIVFTGYIDTAKRQKNRQIVNITAYDELYKIGSKNVAAWFSQFAIHSNNAYIMTLLDSLFSSQIGYDENAGREGLQWLLRWQRSGENNNYTQPLDYSNNLIDSLYKGDITAVDILRSANELMGLFGYMTADGKYTTLSLVNTKPVIVNRWIDLEFEEYETAQIDIVKFTYNDSDRYILGRPSSTHNCYYSDDNILTNCSTNLSQVKNIVSNIMNAGKLGYSSAYSYRPFKLTMVDRLLPNNIGLGSRLKIATGDDEIPYIESFVLQEKIMGIQSLKYEFSAKGDEILNNGAEE